MKNKIWTIVAALTLPVVFAACGEGAQESQAETQPAEEDSVEVADLNTISDANGNTITRREVNDYVASQYKRAPESDVEGAMELSTKAQLKLTTNNWESALRRYEELLALDPDWVEPYYGIGISYLVKGDYDKAREWLTKADEMHPDGYYNLDLALFCLDAEENGTFPKGTFAQFNIISFEYGDERVLVEGKEMAEKHPDFAPILYHLALEHEGAERRKYAEQGLNAKGDPSTIAFCGSMVASEMLAAGETDSAKALYVDLIHREGLTAYCRYRIYENLKSDWARW